MTSELKPRPSPLLRLIRHHRLAAAGAFIVVIFLFVGLGADWIAPHDPNRISVRNALQTPNAENWLGTDHNGRDLLSRIIHGARISMVISFSAVGIAAVLGVLLGNLSAWYRSLEMPIMRMVDVMLSFPGIITALAIISILGPGLENVVIAIVMFHIPQFARLTHGLVLGAKEQAYVLSALSVGSRDSRIMLRHILPNIGAPIIVQISLLIPDAIMTTAALSFLGLGVTPPTAEWGSMLQDSLRWARLAPHVMVFPGLTLMLVVFAFNVFGDGLRAALDPTVGVR
jgi:peptide/nickel transport system permease protein